MRTDRAILQEIGFGRNQLKVTAEPGRQYWLNVNAYNQAIGRVVAEALVEDEQAINLGEVYSGELGGPGDRRRFLFSGVAGQSILLVDHDLERANSHDEVRWELLDPSGNLIPGFYRTGTDDNYLDNPRRLMPVTLPSDGTYELRLTGCGLYSRTESYRFEIDTVGGATPIEDDVAQTIELPPVIGEYYYDATPHVIVRSLDLQAGDLVRINVKTDGEESSMYDLAYRLVDSQGNISYWDNYSGSYGSLITSTSGVHSLVVEILSPSGAATGRAPGGCLPTSGPHDRPGSN